MFTNKKEVMDTANGLNIDFAERLSDFMSINAFSVKELEKTTRISHVLFYQWLHRDFLPSVKNLFILCDLMQCSFDYALGLTEDKKSYRRDDKKLDFYRRIMLLMKEKVKGTKESAEFIQGVNQQTLAQDCGLAKSSFSNWKRGAVLQTKDLMVMANYLNCSVEYLLGISDVR